MTIEFRNSAVFAPRTIKVEDRTSGGEWRHLITKRRKTEITLTPGMNSELDAVKIKTWLSSELPNTQEIVGPKIKTNPECKKLGISWRK